MGAPLPSTLSTIGRVISQRLKSDPFHDATNFDVMIDTPAAAAKSQQESTSTSLLNLFFYRIEPSQFDAGAGAHDRWYVRVLCLVTAFSTSATSDEPHPGTVIPAGEVDLRVLGEVLRYFNENPIIVPSTTEEDVGAHLQVVLTPLTSQEINQIWSTQGEVAYRPSLLYEIALLPIAPKTRSSPSLPVVAGGLNLQSYATMKAARRPPPPPPTVWLSPRMETGDAPDWVPALSFIAGAPQVATQSLSVATAATLDVAVWIAGPTGGKVDVVWQHVDQGAWTVPDNGIVKDVLVPDQDVAVGNGIIDPALAGAATTVAVAVPVPAQLPAYLLLHAERTLADQTVLRSNPLILTVQP